MNRILTLLAALAVASFLRAADTAATAEKSPGDLAFDAVRNAINSRTPDGTKVLEAGFNLVLNFPDHHGVNGLLPLMDSLPARLPEAERAGYTKAFNDRLAAELAKPDLKDSAREVILGAQVLMAVSDQTRAEKPDPAVVRAKIDALAARYPKAQSLAGLELSYVMFLGKIDLAAAQDFLRKSNDPELVKEAGGRLRVAEMRTKPLEMKFTAADGREVDLAKLRGKVVLIDFWATWCNPCIAELPNLTRVYNAYHDKGFEVIGISLENAGIIDEAALKNPRNAGKTVDTPEQVAAKNAKAKEKLLAFTKEKNMPWPQYYDGKYWGNEFGRMYSIHGVPAMFLLDKEGKLVETKARGENLEPLVKKLLGLGT